MKIITNTAISLDGKISLFYKGHIDLGSKEDKRRMQVIRAKADAVLVGGQSFRNSLRPMMCKPYPHHADNPVFNIIVSERMDFKLTRSFIMEEAIFPLFLTHKGRVPKNFACPVIRSPRPITAAWIVKELKEMGIKTLLVEGGGKMIHSFLKAGLIDEMYVTLCPKIIGNSDAPSLVTGKGLGRQPIQLKLLDIERVKGELFLRYRL